MSVDDAAGEPLEEGRTQDLHEARGHHEVGFVGGDRVGQRAVPRSAVLEVAQRDAERRDAFVGGVPFGGTLAIDTDSDDRRGISVGPGGVEQRTQEAARARGEDDEPRRRGGRQLVTRGSQGPLL